MIAHFGQKWLCLFRGPFWQYELNEDSQQTTQIEVPSSSNEELLESLNDNTTPPNSNNEIPPSSNASNGIQHNLLFESLPGLSDQIPPIPIGQNPQRSDGEILASCSDEILVGSDDVIESHGEIPRSLHGQQPASMSDEIPSIANETSLIADALRECSLNLDSFSNSDQGCLSELDDFGFQLDNFGCLVNNENRNSEGLHAVENGKHPAGSFNSRTNRSYLWTNITVEEREYIESGQISPECMEDHHNIVPTTKAIKSPNPYMYDTTKVSKFLYILYILNSLT